MEDVCFSKSPRPNIYLSPRVLFAAMSTFLSALPVPLLLLAPAVRLKISTVSNLSLLLSVCLPPTPPINLIFPVAYEIHRQSTLFADSPATPLQQETRGFDEITFETFRLRSKEDAPDYRYMPDPNLGVLRLSKVFLSVVATAVLVFAQSYISRNVSTASAHLFPSSHGRHVHGWNRHMLSQTETSTFC